MSKILKIKNKQSFVKNFLSTISKISDSVVLEPKSREDDNFLTCLCCTSDNSVFLYIEHPIEEKMDDDIRLNCSDVKKFIRAIDAISHTDEILFTLENNNLSYKDKRLRFKYHLLEDGIIKKPAMNLQKIGQTVFHTNFVLEKESVRNLLKGSVFSCDSNKLYVSANKDGVYAKLTDKTRKNIDSITLMIADEYKGEEIESVPFSFDIFRMMENLNNEILVKINKDRGIVIFEMFNNYNKTIYIMSSLVK